MPKSKLERLFSYKKTILILMLLITIVLGFSARNISTDFNVNPKVSSSAPLNLEKVFLRESSGKDSQENRVITVIVYDQNLFSIKHLKAMKSLEEKLINNEFTSSVESLYSVQDANSYFFDETTRSIILGSEKTQKEVDYAKYQAIHNKLLLNKLINPQATAMAFYVTLKPLELKQLYQARNAIENIIQDYQSQFESVYQISTLEVESYIHQATKHDFTTMGVLALLVLVVIYGVFFGRVAMGLLPFATSALTMIWLGGILAYLDVPLNVLSGVTVVLVFIIGAMECAHFINAYQRSYRGRPDANASFHAANSLRQVFWPIFFATVTTVLGFLFNIFTSVTFLEDFAVAICLAITINSLIICLLLPLLLEVFIKNDKKKSKKGVFSVVADIVLKAHKKMHSKSIIVVVVIFSIISLGVFIAPKIPIEIIPYVNFYKNSSIMMKIKNASESLTGLRKMEVYIEGDQPDAFRSKQNLDKLLTIQRKISELPSTSSTFSMATVIAGLFQVYMDDGDADSEYRVPDSLGFVNNVLSAQEEFPFVGKLLAEDNQAAKIDIAYQLYTTKELFKYIDEIDEILEGNLKGSSLHYEMQNTTLGAVDDVIHIIKIQIISISIIYLAIFLVMWCAFKTYKAGIVATIPNFFPLTSVLMLMYFLQIPFFPITIIVLVAVLGLAVDDTIHIMLSFKKFYKKTFDLDSAIENAVHSQIRPVTITSLSLIVAVALFAFSSLKSIMLFSVLLGFGALAAWVSDMVITPFLLRKINIIKKLNK
jgi:uncharacterized protein